MEISHSSCQELPIHTDWQGVVLPGRTMEPIPLVQFPVMGTVQTDKSGCKAE